MIRRYPLRSVSGKFRIFERFLTRHHSTGLFEIDALSKPDGFRQLENGVYKECTILLQEAAKRDSRRNGRKMVEIVDDLSNSICKVADLAECVRNLHPDPKFVHAAEECAARLSTFVENLNTDVSLYSRVKAGVNEGDETDRRVASLFAVDFEASGVHLPENQRSKFVELSSEIYQVGANFVRGCEQPIVASSHATKKPTNRILSYFTNVNKKNDTTTTNSNDHSVLNTIRTSGTFGDSSQADERELGYKMFYAPSRAQEENLCKLVRLRHDLANVAGFDNFAQRSLRGSILQTPEAVEAFLLQLIECLKPKVEQELNALKPYSPGNKPIHVWDLPYLRGEYRQDRLRTVLHKLKRRFDIQSTLSGLKTLVEQLYGVVLKKVQPEPGEVWHEDVEKLLAYDQTGKFCGTIYCDWYDRPNKTSSDSHFTVRCGKQLPNGEYQQPVVVLAFRYNKRMTSSKSSDQSAAADDSIFNFTEMSNILHEFGHAMHSILGRTKYQHVSGTRCSTDFAEIPSNLMEFYLLDERTFLSFARNNQREILDDNVSSTNLHKDDVIKIVNTFNALTAVDTMQQAVYALFDLRLHWNPPPPGGSSTPAGNHVDDHHRLATVHAFNQLCVETWPFMHVPGTAWHHRFSHLVAYGCKYHAYLVAKAAASLVWRSLFVKDPRDRVAGEKWRQIQAYGGELEPGQLLQMILNKRLTSDDLSKALSSD